MQATHESIVRTVAEALQLFDCDIPLDHIAGALGIPFEIVGSEEWLDRAILTLIPRMKTVIPPTLIDVHRQRFAGLAQYGIASDTVWAATPAELRGALPSAHAAPHVVVCVSAHQPAVMGTVSAHGALPAHITTLWEHAANGVLCVILSRTAAAASFSASQAIRAAHRRLVGGEVLRFPTPQHPLRLEQAWHLGTPAFEVIALAAETAAPLAIVSDTVQRVFSTFQQRARTAANVMDAWLSATDPTTPHDLRQRVGEAYADIDYLFDILVQQYAHENTSRALSIPEGVLIAEVCRDVRVVYRTLCGILGEWEESQSGKKVVGRPGFEPGTKSL